MSNLPHQIPWSKVQAALTLLGLDEDPTLILSVMLDPRCVTVKQGVRGPSGGMTVAGNGEPLTVTTEIKIRYAE